MTFKFNRLLVAGLTAAVVGIAGLSVAPAQADPSNRLLPSDRAIEGIFNKVERQQKRQRQYYRRNGMLPERGYFKENRRRGPSRGVVPGYTRSEWQHIARPGAGAMRGAWNSYWHQGR